MYVEVEVLSHLIEMFIYGARESMDHWQECFKFGVVMAISYWYISHRTGMQRHYVRSIFYIYCYFLVTFTIYSGSMGLAYMLMFPEVVDEGLARVNGPVGAFESTLFTWGLMIAHGATSWAAWMAVLFVIDMSSRNRQGSRSPFWS